MPTTKKPADDKPPQRTAKADAAAAEETPEVTPATTRRTRKPREAAVAPEPVAVPAPAPKPDRTLVAAFAVGFGIGRASSDGPTVFGADRGGRLPGAGPFAGEWPHMPMPHGPRHHGGGMLPGPGFVPHHAPGPDLGGDDPPPAIAGQAFLGIAGMDAPRGGVRVTEVAPGSAADAAGVQPGDRIMSVGDTRIADMERLRELIGAAQPGTTITIGVDRAGVLLTLTATLGTRPD